MAGPLEVFEAAVFEAVFETMSVRDGDAACDVVAAGLAEVVDGLSHADAVQFIAANAPRLIPEVPGGGDTAMVINDFWYRRDTFAPIFFAIAYEFYQRVRPSTYAMAPMAVFDENDLALFGCELSDIRFEKISAHPATENAALLLWAGCSAAAAKLCLQRSIAMPIGYSLLFSFVRNTVS